MAYKHLNERNRSILQTYVANKTIKLCDIIANVKEDIAVDLARADNKSVALPSHYAAATDIVNLAANGHLDEAIAKMPSYAYQFEQVCFIAEVEQLLKDKHIVAADASAEQTEQA